MLDLTMSAMRWSWAVSMLGLQEAADLIRHPTGDKERTFSNIDSMTQSTEDGLHYVLKAGLEAGDYMQGEITDAMSRYLALDNLYDPNKAMRSGTELLWDVSDALRFFLPVTGSGLAWREIRNKFDVYQLVRSVQTKLRVPREGSFNLSTMVEQAYSLGPYPALWAVEGLGHDYGDSVREKGDEWTSLLRGKQVKRLPAKSLLMLNAGIGLSFAQRLLEPIRSTGPESELKEALLQFVRLCEDNATPGYEGAALESLGLVTRTFHPRMVSAVDRHMAEMNEDLLGYYWHGIGRATYFLLLNFLPYRDPIWRAIEIGRQNSLHEIARSNTTAGTAWALTLVNMRHPQIMASFLKEYGDELVDDQTPFANGVASSLIMRFDTSPDDSYIEAFRNYAPGSSDKRLERTWKTFIKDPIDQALDHQYEILKKAGQLGQVFRYQPLDRLADEVRPIRKTQPVKTKDAESKQNA